MSVSSSGHSADIAIPTSAPGKPPASKFNVTHFYLAIMVAALVPRLYLGVIQSVAFDGYWHVFTATQDRWPNMIREYKADAHPILYYLLLRLVAALGHAPLIYRSISILPGVAAIWVVAKIAGQVCKTAVMPVLAAAAYAFAITSIDLSIDVRSYMGSLFFVLLSFYWLLRALTPASDRRAASSWLLFAVFASIAIGFEYYAVLYVTACAAAVAVSLLGDSSFRSRINLLQPAAALVIPAVTIWYFYRSHIVHQPPVFPHLGGFYWNPDGVQSRSGYLLENLQKTFSYFLPVHITVPALVVALLVILFAALFTFSFARAGATDRLRYRAVVWMPVAILLQLMVLGLARKYPFGGEMRQQSILAPFLLINLFLLLDRLISLLRSARLRQAGLFAVGVAVAASAYYQWLGYFRVPQVLFTSDYRDFSAAVPNPNAVYLDQYSLVAYYMHTDKWDWRSQRRIRIGDRFEQFRTTSPSGQTLDIIRDRTTWNADYSTPSPYATFANLLREHHQSSLSVFHLNQMGPVLTSGSPRQQADRIRALAHQAGLTTTALYVQATDLFATFRLE